MIFEFSGESDDLVVSGKSNCVITAALTDVVSLFSNLTLKAKSMATKSRRFN